MALMLYMPLFFVFIVLPGIALYRAFFSPLSKIPGPRLWAMTRIPWAYHLFIGDLAFKIAKLHNEYGSVIRIAPQEVSWTTAEAFSDILLKPWGKPELAKDARHVIQPPHGVKSLFYSSSDSEHTRIRKNFSHAFSDKGMREQEPIVLKYIDHLILRLRDRAGKPVDMTKWYNFTTFDTIGDLTLGESFHCLDTATLHAWIAMIFDWVAGAAAMGCLKRFQPLGHILTWIIPQKLKDAESEHRNQSRMWLQKRLTSKAPRQDFLSHVIPNMGTPTGLTEPELLECVRVLIGAGSETTATTLSAATYFLLANPSTFAILKSEILSSFTSSTDINMANLNNLKLPYLLAVINETLRCFPPVPGSVPRLTPPEGHMISGLFIPGNTVVAPHPYSSFHSPRNFTRPEDFCPERWLSPTPEEFRNDNRAVVQPFGIGPRNCLGKNLAYMEIRLILARLVWEFDFQLEEESMGWVKGMKIHGLWKKPALMVRITPRGGLSDDSVP